MSDIVKCKCGKASMEYFPLEEEDQWIATALNTKISTSYDGGLKLCTCKICGDFYDEFDPCLVIEINHKTAAQ